MSSAPAPIYKRILLKLSGEALLGAENYGIDPAVATQIAKEIGEIQAMGVLVKDLDTGLVDFPATRDGEDILLCWQLGEDEVAYWHGLEDGYAGRQPL